jgi:hypothetical protein
MSVRFIYIGDPHLGRLVGLLAELTDAATTIRMQLAALRMIYNYARKKDIKHIIYLGDLFHTSSPRQTTIALFLQFLREYPEMHNYIIIGNHDHITIGVHSQQVLSSIGKYIQGSNIYVFDKPTSINIAGIPTWFCPWPYVEAPTTPHICIGHFDIAGAYYADGYVVKNKIAIEDLGKDNFWVIGHIHIAQNHYPGTLYQVNFDEPPEKGFLQTNAKFSNGKLQVNSYWQPITPIFILHNIEYKNATQLADIAVSKTHLWRLIRRKDSPPVPQEWLINHPNVSVSEIREPATAILPVHTAMSLQNSSEISPDWQLKEFLEERGVPTAAIIRGREIVRDIIRKVAN